MRETPGGVSLQLKFHPALCAADGWLAERSVRATFGQPEPVQHPVDRVARYAQQLGRAMAIALGRLQSPNQRELRGLADYSVERIGPFLSRVVRRALDQVQRRTRKHRLGRDADRFRSRVIVIEWQVVDIDPIG